MTRKIRILGVPMDLGQDRRGVDMGPSAMRVARLGARIAALGYQVEDCGNVPVRVAEEISSGQARAKYLGAIADTCKAVAQHVARALTDRRLPLVLGGDHSIAIGTLAGVAWHFRRRQQQIGCLWLDAHGDMNTPQTTPSGNVHGMPLAAVLGYGARRLTHLLGFAPKLAAANCALVGVRDLDRQEKRIVRRSGIRVFTMREIDERGMRPVLAEALRLAQNGTAGFHVSLDMDVLNPDIAPGVGTAVRGGVTYREAHLAMEMIADTGKMVSLEVVEMNPMIDVRNQTAELAVELALSALGKKIL